MFIIFVSMAMELTDRQNFTKYCNSNANYLVSANRNMDYEFVFPVGGPPVPPPLGPPMYGEKNRSPCMLLSVV